MTFALGKFKLISDKLIPPGYAQMLAEQDALLAGKPHLAGGDKQQKEKDDGRNCFAAWHAEEGRGTLHTMAACRIASARDAKGAPNTTDLL
jgi:hypothetical protein